MNIPILSIFDEIVHTRIKIMLCDAVFGHDGTGVPITMTLFGIFFVVR